jgi:hypothetical protein
VKVYVSLPFLPLILSQSTCSRDSINLDHFKNVSACSPIDLRVLKAFLAKVEISAYIAMMTNTGGYFASTCKALRHASTVNRRTVLASEEAKVYNASSLRLRRDAVSFAGHLQRAHIHGVELYVMLTLVEHGLLCGKGADFTLGSPVHSTSSLMIWGGPL